MALYHKWDVKNGFTYVLTFFSLISGGLGGVIACIMYAFAHYLVHSLVGLDLEQLIFITKKGFWNPKITICKLLSSNEVINFKSVKIANPTSRVYYMRPLISGVSISAIFDLTWFIILSYFPPL